MKFNSINFKIQSFIIIAFVITIASVLYLSNIHITKILDKSQEVVYTEKTGIIWSQLNNANLRLVKTGLVEAYIGDFKESALQKLMETDFKQVDSAVFPFIIDTKNEKLIYPNININNPIYTQIDKYYQSKNDSKGSFFFDNNGQEYWCLYRNFDGWGWVIGYTMPLHIKYRDARSFFILLVVTMLGIAVFMVITLSVLITRMIKPIVQLEEATSRIAGGELDCEIEISSKDELGKLARSFSIMRDAIKEKIIDLKRLTTILETTSDFVALANLDTEIIYLNSAGRKMIGLKGDKTLTGKKLFQLLPKWALDLVQKKGIPEATKNGVWEGETAILDEYDNEIPVSQVIMSHRSPEGNLTYLSTIIRDIREIKQAELEIRKARNYISNIINSMPSVLVGVDSSGRITQWNKAAEQISGIDSVTAAGQFLFDIFPDLESDFATITRSIIHKQVFQSQHKLNPNSSDERYEEVTIFPLIVNGDKGAVVRVDNVTEKVQLQEKVIQLNKNLENKIDERTRELNESLNTLKVTQGQLIRSERLAALGNMVAGLAHEINTPIGIAVTESSFLGDNIDSVCKEFENEKLTRSSLDVFFKDASESAQSILRNLARSADLINSFKQVAVDQISIEKRKFFLKEYLQEVILSMNSKFKRTKHEVVIDCPDELEIESYPGAFSQIFTNLILNSLIHGFEGIEAGEITIGVSMENDVFQIQYQDNGVGMPLENCKQIFDPFFTTKRNSGGTGLGMNIVFNLVTQKLGGQISCSSQPNTGVYFAINLPNDE